MFNLKELRDINGEGKENRGCKGKGKAKLRSSISYIIIIITDGRFGLGKKINFQLRLEFSSSRH